MSSQDTTTKEKRDEVMDRDQALADELSAQFSMQPDPQARWDYCLLCDSATIVKALRFLRDQRGFNVLLDITAIDYLSFPGHRDARFAVVYIVKNLDTCQRMTLKVMVEEDELRLPSICHLWKNANWLERETFDQYGIDFQGHPNQKRLLNHHEFVGHPLRKDYPVQKRQKLSVNDPMIDQLIDRLEHNGYAILEEATVNEALQAEEEQQ